MEHDDPSPSPKRRRTSSHGSAYSSQQSSPEPGAVAYGKQATPNQALPLRRADTGRLRGGRYSESKSRDDSLDRDGRYKSQGRGRRSLSRDSIYSPRSARSHSRIRSRSPSSHASRSRSGSGSYSPPPSKPAPKSLGYQPLHTLPKAHARGITCLKFSPDGTLLASSSADATINIYSIGPSQSMPDFKLLRTLRGHQAGINAIAWSPTGPPYILASASDDKSILLWSPSVSDQPLKPSPLDGHSNYVYSLAFSPKGNMLVTGSYDEAVFLWDVRSARVMRSLPAHSDPVGGVDFLRDGSMMVSCATDGLIRIWDSGTGQCLRTLVDEDRKAVTSVQFSPNGEFVLAWTLDNCIRLWRYKEGTCVKTYQGHVNKQYSLSGMIGEYGSGEAFIVSGSEDGDVVAWDMNSKEVLWRGQGHRAVVLSVDCTKTAAGMGLLVSGGLDRDIRFWYRDADGDLTTRDGELADIQQEDTAELSNGHLAVDVPEETAVDTMDADDG